MIGNTKKNGTAVMWGQNQWSLSPLFHFCGWLNALVAGLVLYFGSLWRCRLLLSYEMPGRRVKKATEYRLQHRQSTKYCKILSTDINNWYSNRSTKMTNPYLFFWSTGKCFFFCVEFCSHGKEMIDEDSGLKKQVVSQIRICYHLWSKLMNNYRDHDHVFFFHE